MAKWIRTTDNTLINLDHATRVSAAGAGAGGTLYRVELSDQTCCHIALYEQDMDKVLAEVMPSNPGHEIIVADLEHDAEGRPINVEVSRYPVIGWRILAQDSPLPVTTLDLGLGGVGAPLWGIILPGDRVLRPFVAEHDTVEAFRESALKSVQSQWDAKQAREAKQPLSDGAPKEETQHGKDR